MRAAIYARVSTRGQAQAQTIEQQLTRLRAHIQQKGWVLEAEQVYLDDGYSGAKLARPGLDALRDQATLAAFDVVVITSPDRLARNYLHQMIVLDELTQRQVQVEFLDRPMSDDPNDRLLLQIRGAVAEYERALITERTRRGRLQKYRQQQLLPWTRPLFGYRVDPTHPRDPAGVQLDLAEAAIVGQIFQGYLEPGATLYRVAQHLTQSGIPTPGGKSRWKSSSVRNLLRNTAYIGTAYANRVQTLPARRHRSALQAPDARGETQVERPQQDWIAVPVPAIVDTAIFQRVQDKLAQNRQAAARNNKTHPYLLRGLVSCGLCRLSAPARTSQGYAYYVCKGHSDAQRAPREERCTARFIPAPQLDELVWQDVVAVLTQPEHIAQALQRAHGGLWLPHELQTQQANQRRAEQQLTAQQARLLDAYLAQVIDLPEFERKRLELTRKQEVLHQQQTQLQASMAQRRELTQVSHSMEQFCQTVRLGLDHPSFEQKRQLVQLLIDRVIVLDGQVDIRYAVPTRPDGPHLPFCHLRKDYRVQLPRCQAVLGPGRFHEHHPHRRDQRR
jgi:site-specific DNA recombinase